MSPILLRPIREQIEHDRVIRLLQSRLRRRYAVATNIGDEPEGTPVTARGNHVYPDLVLTTTEGGRRLHGVIEVETAESVNHLEAMSQWVHFARARGAFYLYVPAGTTDVALRLCEEHAVPVTEIWSFHAVGDQMRFTMTYRSPRAAARARAAREGGKPPVERRKAATPRKKTATPPAKARKRTGTTRATARATAAPKTKAAKRATGPGKKGRVKK